MLLRYWSLNNYCLSVLRSVSANHQPGGRLPAAQSSDFPARADTWPASSPSPRGHRHLSWTLLLSESWADGWPTQPALRHHGALPHLPSGQRSALWPAGALLRRRPGVGRPSIWPAPQPSTEHQRELLILQARVRRTCRLRQEFLLQCALRGRRTRGTCCHLWWWRVQPTVRWAAGGRADGLWRTLASWANDECPAECHFPRLLRMWRMKDWEADGDRETNRETVVWRERQFCLFLSSHSCLSFCLLSFVLSVCVRFYNSSLVWSWRQWRRWWCHFDDVTFFVALHPAGHALWMSRYYQYYHLKIIISNNPEETMQFC